MLNQMIRKALCCLVALAVFWTSVDSGHAAELTLGALPTPGQMVGLSAAAQPSVLTGVKVYADQPFRFDFIMDKGSDDKAGPDAVQASAGRLIRYFLASLTVPEKDLWVNLSPYEKDRIITNEFGQTEMGRDLLTQDYLLKQLTASVIYPEGKTGKEFWAKVYQKAYEKYGTTDIPVDTFNKVWIVPEKAVVYEKATGTNDKSAVAYVVQSKLKVMLESDYLAQSKAPAVQTPADPTMVLAKSVLREVVIPVLEREVNEGANFSQLRQVYHSLILAAWYKRKVKESLLSKVYVDQKKITGVNIDDPKMSEKIWAQYVEAFKKGAYNFIKEEQDLYTGETIPRKYFSGGILGDMAQALTITTDFAALPQVAAGREVVVLADFEPTGQANALMPDRAMKSKKEGSKILTDVGNTHAALFLEALRGLRKAGLEVIRRKSERGIVRRVFAGRRVLNIGLQSELDQQSLKERLSSENIVTMLRSRGIEAFGVDPLAAEGAGRPDYFRNGSAERVPFPDNSFDDLISIGLFDVNYFQSMRLMSAPANLASWQKVGKSIDKSYDDAAHEARRVLKPGGRFFLDMRGQNKDFLAALRRDDFEISDAPTLAGIRVYLCINTKKELKPETPDRAMMPWAWKAVEGKDVVPDLTVVDRMFFVFVHLLDRIARTDNLRKAVMSLDERPSASSREDRTILDMFQEALEGPVGGEFREPKDLDEPGRKASLQALQSLFVDLGKLLLARLPQDKSRQFKESLGRWTQGQGMDELPALLKSYLTVEGVLITDDALLEPNDLDWVVWHERGHWALRVKALPSEREKLKKAYLKFLELPEGQRILREIYGRHSAYYYGMIEMDIFNMSRGRLDRIKFTDEFWSQLAYPNDAFAASSTLYYSTVNMIENLQRADPEFKEATDIFERLIREVGDAKAAGDLKAIEADPEIKEYRARYSPKTMARAVRPDGAMIVDRAMTNGVPVSGAGRSKMVIPKDIAAVRKAFAEFFSSKVPMPMTEGMFARNMGYLNTVNPEGRPLTVFNSGSGADLVGVITSTGATTIFMVDSNGFQFAALKDFWERKKKGEKLDHFNDAYLDSKRFGGYIDAGYFDESGTLGSGPNKMARAISAELESMGVDAQTVKFSRENELVPYMEFELKFLGHIRTVRVNYVNTPDLTDPSAYSKQLQLVLDKPDNVFDVYYESAGQVISDEYERFIPYISRFIRPNGFWVIDDPKQNMYYAGRPFVNILKDNFQVAIVPVQHIVPEEQRYVSEGDSYGSNKLIVQRALAPEGSPEPDRAMKSNGNFSKDVQTAFEHAGDLQREDIGAVLLMEELGVREGQKVLSVGPSVDVAHLIYPSIKNAAVDVNQPEFYTPGDKKQPHLEYLKQALELVPEELKKNVSAEKYPLPIQEAGIPSNTYDFVALLNVLDGVD